MFNTHLKMPKRAVGVLRNLQGHAMHNTKKTALQKTWRRQSIAIPIPQGGENLNKALVWIFYIFLPINTFLLRLT